MDYVFEIGKMPDMLTGGQIIECIMLAMIILIVIFTFFMYIGAKKYVEGIILTLVGVIFIVGLFSMSCDNDDIRKKTSSEYINIAYDKYDDYSKYIIGVENIQNKTESNLNDARILIEMPDKKQYTIDLYYTENSKYKGIKTIENSDRDYYVLEKDSEGLTLIHYKESEKLAEPTYSSEFALVTEEK